MSISSNPKFFYGWWIVIAAGIMLAFTTVVYANGIGILLPSPYLALLVFPIAAGIGILIAPFVGIMVDRYGPRRIVLSGVILAGAGYLLVSITKSTWDFHAAMVPLAIGMNLCATVVFAATVGKWFVKRRVRAFGILMAISSIAPYGTATLGVATEVFDWRSVMIGIAALILLIGLPVALVMRSRPEDEGVLPDGDSAKSDKRQRPIVLEVSPNAGQILRLRPFWQITIALALTGSLVATSAAGYQISDFGNLNYSALAIETLASWILVPVGAITMAFVGDRSDKKHLLIKLVALKGVALAMLYLGTMPLVPEPMEVVSILIGQSISSFAAGALVPLVFGVLADYFGRERLGTVFGINSSMSELVSIGIIGVGALFVFVIGWGSFEFPLWAKLGFWLLRILLAVHLIRTLESKSRVAARIRVMQRRAAAP